MRRSEGTARGTRRSIAWLTGLSVTLGALFVGGTIAGTEASGAPTPSSVVDDKTTSGTNKFAYTGTWTSCGGCNSGAYQNSFKYSNATGASVTLTFVGTQATLYGYKEQWGGIATVSVDGGAAVDVDFYQPTQALTGLYATPVMAQGTHTVKMAVSGRSSGSSKTINIDRADVFVDSVITPTPSTTTTSAPPTTSTTKTSPPPSTSTTTSAPPTTSTTTSAPPTTPSGPPTAVDDKTTSGTNRFSYTGTWVNCGGCNSGAYQNSFKYSNTVGSTATLTFTGAQATLYGYKEQWGGIAGVSVDGGASVDVNLYSATQVLGALYTTPALASGTHTVVMTVTGRSTSGNSTINIDKADVYSSGTVPTTSVPPSSSTSSSSTAPTTSTTSTAPTTSTSKPPTTTPPTGAGMVSFSFDDSQQNHYDVVRPILHGSGVNGTFYVVGASLGWSGSLTPAMARTMATEGDELGNHTQNHPVLTSVSTSQVESEFSSAQSAIKAATGVTPETCAYPSGQSNAAVQQIAAKYFRGCRGTGPGQNSASSLAAYNLVVLYAQTSTTAAQVKAAAEQAKANNSWLILVYHGVGDVYSSDDVTAATLQGHVDAVKAAGVPIKTVKAALAAYGR